MKLNVFLQWFNQPHFSGVVQNSAMLQKKAQGLILNGATNSLFLLVLSEMAWP